MNESTPPPPSPPGPHEAALNACKLAGKHLLNALASVGIDPAEIPTQSEALDRVWPTPWAYDAWSAWHACRVALRAAGWDTSDISTDRRTEWRSRAVHEEAPEDAAD